MTGFYFFKFIFQIWIFNCMSLRLITSQRLSHFLFFFCTCLSFKNRSEYKITEQNKPLTVKYNVLKGRSIQVTLNNIKTGH